MAPERNEPGGTGCGSALGRVSGVSDRSRCARSRVLVPPSTAFSTSMSSSGNNAASDTSRPLPIAVCRCSAKRSMAARSASRSRVGGWTSAAVPANVTMAMRVSSGCFCTNAFAAFCAATSRFGSTSRARMLSETSIAITMVRLSDGSVTVAVGRAIARIATISPSRNSNGGMCRRRLCRGPSASLSGASVA